MGDKEYTAALIQTKLHRPPLPADLVPRPRLTELLNLHSLPPLILISAPAGYGKSTLAKCLVAAWDYPSAWLSLDQHDNDLRGFLRYFLAAVQSIFPDALPETEALLMASPLPPISAIAKILINELDQIKQPFNLVLDDYQLIEKQAIHDLLNDLLLYPPRNLHLVLCTRMDPMLPLVTLRANSQLTEIRTQDLRFNQEETQLLFQKMIGETIDQFVLSQVDTRAEGWVTGLRLAALALRHRIGRDSFEGELSLNNRYVTEYLVTEILAKQAASLSDCMLKTSIMERFCAGLCEAVCVQGEGPAGDGSTRPELTGDRFMRWLQASNMFVIPLDDQNKWFRYHHLFQDFLQQELTRRLSLDEIAKLHSAAGRWYAHNGWIDEALYHLLAAGEEDAAIQIVAQQRYSMMNATRWPNLEGWLNLFSTETVERSPELWMLKTWLVYHRGGYSELPALLEHLETVLENQPSQSVENDLAGEICTLRSLLAYHFGQAEEAISQAQQALEVLPPELWIVRVLARTYLGASYLLRGDENRGYHAYYGAFEEEQVQDKRFRATLLMTACNFHWLTADLKSMAQAAKQCIALCQEIGYQEILGYGNYQLGRVRYHQDNLPMAKELFTGVFSRPYLNYGTAYTNSACGLGMTYQALGKEVEARQVAEGAIAFLLETGNTSQLPLALALQAELALMQGGISLASQWAEKLDPVPPLTPMPWFLAPHLTLVKVWIAQNTPTSLDKAAELLSQLEEYLVGNHNTRFLIETLVLQALLDHARADQPAALTALEKALRLAQPGGFIRLFADLGPQVAYLLNQLRVDRELDAYLNQIRSAFPGTQPAPASLDLEKLAEPLTNRELEVLSLLAERRTNKEIALQLGITPGTVRQHSYNLYQKLDVGNRRQAVARAFELGVLREIN